MKLALKEDPEEHRIALFILLLCACIVIGHLLEKNRWINESVTAIFIVSCFLLGRFRQRIYKHTHFT